MYSLIRTSERAKANELHLRIIEEEESFSDLASEYSEGIEQQVNGLIGPIELGRINPAIAERLRISNQGQLWDPFEEEGWWVLLRLEKLLPAKLDEAMKERIINDLHNSWLNEKVKEQLSNIMAANQPMSQTINPQPENILENSKDHDDTSLFRKVLGKLSNNKNKS